MADAYYDKYNSQTHEQLYQELEAGDPDSVNAMSAKFTTMRETLNTLHTKLGGDLSTLMDTWDSSSGQEFKTRIDSVTTFSSGLHDDFDNQQRTLTEWATLLKTAKSQAENPSKTDNNDNMVKDAATGAVIGTAIGGPVGGVVGGVIGGVFGHNEDSAEKEKARQRMVQLVAQLSADYETNDRAPTVPTQPPANLPGNTDTGPLNVSAGPGVATPSSVGATPGLKPADEVRADTSGSTTTTDGTSDPGGTGTELLSAGGQPMTGLGGSNGLSPSGYGPTSGLSGGPGMGGPVFGGFSPEVEIASANSSPLSGGSGRGLFSEPNPALEEEMANRQGAGRGGAGGRGLDEGDEHLTWLTEDEMVWGNDHLAPPAVLGGGEPATPEE